MRRVTVVFLAFVAVQAMTSVDPSIRSSWLGYGCFGLAALTLNWATVAAFEFALWLRVMAVPVFYFYWGRAPDVVYPGLACTILAYSVWCVRGRRRTTFLIPLAVPVAALAVTRCVVLPTLIPPPVIDAVLHGSATIVPAPMPPGQVRYHCAGYSIAVPLGMTSGFLGNVKADTFQFHDRPATEPLQSMVMVFPRPTAFVDDPDVQAMAAQILGVANEHDYARYVLSATDGYMFINEKLGWLGMKPPEQIEELHVGRVDGFLMSVERVNWYRARLYFDHDRLESQVDIWFYGDDPGAKANAQPLTRKRVLEQLATLRIEPEERVYPTLDHCRNLAASGALHQENILLNSLLSLNGCDYEALYLLGRNHQTLGLNAKAFEIQRHLNSFVNNGVLSTASLHTFAARYGPLGPFPAVR